MTFTQAEKLQIAILCDLAKPPNERELDFNFIHEVVMGDQIWALHHEYPGLQLNIETPEEVSLVCDALDMWESIEESFDALDEAEKERVQKESYSSMPPRFTGFSGDDAYIAGLLVNKMGRWTRFDGRDLDSHSPSHDMHCRHLAVWKPIHKEKFGSRKLAADDLIKILRERIHPEHRRTSPDGGWTLDKVAAAPEG